MSLGASRLSRGAFQVYIEGLTEDMDLTEFEEFADYLLTSVKVGVCVLYTHGICYFANQCFCHSYNS